ncbi:MAG: MFS transporter [Muribaculaceae bacterium]|nr:MFS transporter [Muribaculaceae bacterium]
MTNVSQKINNSATLRWTVLALVSITMMMGYIVAKQMSPLQYFLELPTSSGGLGWTSGEFGVLAGSRGFFNVFFLMLFVGGIILDLTGVRFAGILSCVLMLAGTAIDYYAIAFMDPSQVLNINLQWIAYTDPTIKTQVVVAALGFATFGIGYELCGITVSKVVVKWFTGKEMALAMGIQVALARLGTGLALSGAPKLATDFSLSTPILVGLFAVGVGLIIYLLYCSIDRKGSTNMNMTKTDDDEKFHFSDLGATMKNPGFWLITFLCLLYYSALYPFLDFATKMMIAKYGVEPSIAGNIPAILPYTSIVLTPLFGGMYDKIGKGATIMIIGTMMLTLVLMVFALPLNSSALAITLMLILGIAFSLLPSVLWPAVPKIVPMKQLGTAYSIIYYIQNIGLMLIPIVIGGVLQRNTVVNNVDYTEAMWIFTGIGVAAIIVSVMLLLIDRRKNYGLQKANIKGE